MSTDTPTWQDVVSNAVYGAGFERKTVNDLVGRFAQGDHIRQLRRLQMSALFWPVLLLEGDDWLAETRGCGAWSKRVSASMCLYYVVYY